MNLRIKSDFTDWYDHMGNPRGELVLHRDTRDGMNRPEMLAWLGKRWETPVHGWVKELIGRIPYSAPVVVYESLTGHCGADKLLLPFQNALRDFPHKYACQYVSGRRGWSSRRLQIGQRTFWLEYQSANDWRSNVGEVKITYSHESPQRGYHPEVPYPLWAVDFVVSASGHTYAVDFNVAPGMRHTGMKDVLTASEVVRLLEEAVAHWAPVAV